MPQPVNVFLGREPQNGRSQEIDRFQVIELISQGSYGKIYSCNDTLTNKQAVMKQNTD